MRVCLASKMTDPLGDRPAGLAARRFDETAGKNLQPDIYYPTISVTNTVQEKKKTHVPDIVHGVATRKTESVARTFDATHKSRMREVLNEMKEQIYASNKIEPLGRSRIYGYQLPPCEYVFGSKPRGDKITMAETLNPPDFPIIEPEQIRALYRKTHNDYDAGEQRVRGYRMPQTVRESPQFRFGKESRRTEGSVGECLKWYNEQSS